MISHTAKAVVSLKYYIYEYATKDTLVFQYFTDGASQLVDAAHASAMDDKDDNKDVER